MHLLVQSENSPQLLQVLLKHIPVAVAMFDTQMCLIAASHKWLSDYGLNSECLIGRCYYEIFPQSSDRWKMIHQRCLTGAVANCEADKITGTDGEIEWIKWECRPWNQDNGEIGGIIFSSEKVTEQIHCCEALTASEKRFRKLAATVPGVIYQFRLDADGEMSFPYISSGCRRFLEIEPLKVEQDFKVVFNLIHPDDRDSYLESMRLSADTLLPWLWEGRVVTQSGKCKWVRCVLRPEKQSGCNIVWGGLMIDISDKIQIEEKLRQYQQDLESKVKCRTAELQAANKQLQAQVAQRQKVEKTLCQAEVRLEKMAANVPGMIYQYVLRPDGYNYFSYVSPGCYNIFELKPEQILKNVDNTFERTHPDDLPNLKETIAVSARSLQPWKQEWRIITPSGELKWVKAHSKPEKQANGNIVWDGMVMDITELKHAEEDVQKFVSLIENSFDFIAIAALNTQTLFLNEAGKKLVGINSDEEYRQTTIADYHTPEDWEYFEKNMVPIIQDTGRWQGEFRFKHCKTGKLIPIDYNVFIIKDQKTEKPIAFATVTRDISARKKAEAAIKESEAKYRELARREKLLNNLASQIRESLDLNTVLKTAIQQIRDLLDIDRCSFSWFNPHTVPPIWETIEESKNNSLPSLIGRHSIDKVGSVTELFINQEILKIDDASKCEEPIHRQFLESLGIKSEIVLPIQTRSGHIGVIVCGHWAETRPWTDGEVELLQAVVDQLAIAINQADLYAETQQTALNAQKQAQQIEQTLQQLQKTQSQLVQSEKMSGLGQLVAGVAHEINNPVNFIYGNLIHANNYAEDILSLLKLYEEEYSEPTPEIEEEREALDIDFLASDLPKLMKSMMVGAERIRGIVQSLRTFSRLDEAEMKTVDIHEGIESTLMILQYRIKPKQEHSGIEIIKQYADLPKVVCFAGQLNQVFMNLIANAIDALEEGVVKGEVSAPQIKIITEILDNKCIAIHIIDNGTGISEEVQRRLFDPFFTTKPVGVGTGLGLSISYQIIVDKHGGELHCFSKLGQGTEFIIKIPTTQSESS